MFLKNCWYAALWSQDLGASPVARTLLNEPVVLFRKADGTPAALTDRCCHRAAPLSRGRCVGDYLECGYHGLQFDATGTCVAIPGQSAIPPEARVRSYPVREIRKTVWIWMGDPDKADESAIPDLPWLDDPGWVSTPGEFNLKANYQLLVDNLLDITHALYVHRNTIGADPSEGTAPSQTERLDDGIRITRWLLDVVPPPLFAKVGGFTGNVDRWQIVTWRAPSTVYLDVGAAAAGTGAPEGDRSQGFSIWSTHLLTPETDRTTHYHWGYARNFDLGNDALTKTLYEGSRDTFYEDVEMIDAQQKNLASSSLDGLVDITGDGPQLQARRMIDRLIAAEAAS